MPAMNATSHSRYTHLRWVVVKAESLSMAPDPLLVSGSCAGPVPAAPSDKEPARAGEVLCATCEASGRAATEPLTEGTDSAVSASTRPATGSRTVKTVPHPGTDLTSAWPPCAAATEATIDSPRPEPPAPSPRLREESAR